MLWRRNRELGKKMPFKEPLPRSPGESCRQKLEELQSKLEERGLAVMAILVAIPFLSLFLVVNPDLSTAVVLILGFLVACVGFWIIRPILDDIFNYRLGLQGEQVVGQALTEFLAKGYRVYHDLQFDGFNIDHVLVGPAGVYCIETKARSKSDKVDGHKVVYDGKTLLFPNGEESWGLEQAVQNTKFLSHWLAKSSGEKVMVHPVLVLPGWFVERKTMGLVHVLNHKQIGQILPNEVTLSPDQIQRIAHQLQQMSTVTF